MTQTISEYEQARARALRKRKFRGDLASYIVITDGEHTGRGDPEAAALAYFDQHLAGKSAAALACAVTASRGGWVPELRSRLETVERIYLDTLMRTRDANEGLKAFIDKRPPTWEHH